MKDVYGNTETTTTEADGSTSTTKTTTDGKTTINEVRANGVTIDIENDGRNKTTIAKDAEGYVLEMKQYRNEDPEITLVDALGETVDIETARNVIRNMDLNIKAEDIDNLKVAQEEVENVATEDNTAVDENAAEQNIENTAEENIQATDAQNAESNIDENNNAENADNNIETTQNNTQQQ